MNIIETFNTLTPPETPNRNLFNAVSLYGFTFAKVAISSEGFPVILISSVIEETLLSQKNFRLKYLELTHNVECKISEGSNTGYAIYTVIVFKSEQSFLQRYFFEIVETLIKSLSVKPTQAEVAETFRAFVEIFRPLSHGPIKTIQGLWSELFIIETSKQPAVLLNYWHSKPEEKFDFNADVEKLEVKSSSSLERIHTFSSDQLNPPIDQQVIVASVFLKQIAHGKSIVDLVYSIQQRVAEHDLIKKMFAVISTTLGNTLEQSIKIKFDYELANNSLRFYKHQDISRIERINIPNKISGVRYKSDLTSLKTILPNSLSINGLLYIAI